MQHLTIKNWSIEDRPREKLSLKGASALSNAELFGIIIGSGTTTDSAVDIAKRLLHAFDNKITNIAKLSIEDLVKIKGIGTARAVGIIAALELGRRKATEEVQKLTQITTSSQVSSIMQPYLSDLKHEEFWVIYLSRNNSILKKERISQGGISGTVIDVRIIFQKAISLLSSSIILCHNHPSGNIKPSSADISITEKLKKAGTYLDCLVIDHVIITQNDYFSFADEGII